MNSTTLHPTSDWGAAIRRDFRTVGAAARRDALLLGAIVLLVTLLMLFTYLRARENPNIDGAIDFDPRTGTAMVLLGLLVPMSIWRGEEPSRRGYFWAFPLDRTRHTLAKVLGGWGWFMILLAAYFGWALVMALITGGRIGTMEVGVFLGDPSSVRREDLAQLEWATPAWQWLAPFAAATVTYLLGSAIVILSDHPWRWYAGLFFAYFLGMAALNAAGLAAIGETMASVINGRYGLAALAEGMTPVARTVTSPAGETATRMVSLPSLGNWLGAAAIWMPVSLGAVVAAASVHQER